MHADDDRTNRALAAAHQCPPNCASCIGLQDAEDDYRPGLLVGWEDFVQSDQALRFAHNEVEYGIPFPTVSRDDLVQYVVRESVLERYHAERQAEQEAEERRTYARNEAQRRLREAVTH